MQQAAAPKVPFDGLLEGEPMALGCCEVIGTLVTQQLACAEIVNNFPMA